MTLNLIRRSVKGSPLTAADHDGNLDKLEDAIEASVPSDDPALTNAREWTAQTISQEEAEAGTATTRRAFTAQRVFQAVAAWWAGSAAKTKLDGIEAGAQVNVGTDLSYTASSRLLASSTGADVTLPLATTSAAGLLSGADKTKLDGIEAGAEANVNADWNASSGDAQILNKPTIPAAADAAPQPLGVAAIGSSTDYAREDHVHAMPSAANVGADPAGTAASAVSAHVAASDPHPGYLLESDPAVTNAREWTADTISQLEAETGTATTRRAFTAQRVFQAIAAWWTASGLGGRLLPAGGTTGQFLRKASGTDYDAAWAALPATDLSYTASTRLLESSTGADVTLPLVATSAAGLAPATSFAAITYAATVDLDMETLDGQYRTISLTGNLELTTSNRATGRTMVLRLVADATQRTLTFPSGWVFVGTKPANIAASKSGILSLTFFGTADSDCIAVWGVQA